MKNNFKVLFCAIFIFTLFLSFSTVCASDLDNSTIELSDNENDLSHIENSNDLDELKTSDSVSSNGAASNEVYVDYNSGSDDNSGSDWNNAFKTIEKSLECVEEDGVIHVAEGITYLSDSTSNEGIAINQKVSIIGQNVNSIISGNNNKRIFNIGLNAEVFISNLTLTEGYSSDGGAIYIESSSATSYGKLTMSNSVISNCYATSRGGAIYTNMGSISDINNVTFINDSSVSNGGAISIQQRGSLSNINDCKFINNSAANRGGAIYLGSNSICAIGDNNLFESNKAVDRYGYGGAIHGANGITLGTGNVFANNFAENGGSALSTLNNKEITGSSCFFINNTAGDDSSIVYGNRVVATLENCYWGSNTPLFSGFVYNQNTWAPENYLVLSILANDSVISGNEIPIVVDFSKNQNNQTVDLNSLPKDISILFSADNGDFDVSNPKFINGIATTNYIAKNAGNDTVTVDIYGAVFTLNINVIAKRGTVFVNYTGGSDSNDGDGWSSAVKTISHALDIVGDDNPIYVANGANYLDDNDVNGLLITKNISIIGVGDNVIIDAKNLGRIFYVDGFALSLSNLILANANVSNANDQRGGAIWANNSVLDIDNCKFINNTAGNSNSYGGAINLKYSIANIRQSSFDNNAAWYAGGAINAENTNVLLNISHSDFTNNKILNNGWSTGAAICSYNTVNIYNSIFYNNTLTDKSRKGKSVNQYKDGSLTIKNSALLDGDSSVQVANVSTAHLEDNWWGNNNQNKDSSPAINYTNGNVNSYLILETSINQDIVHVGDLVTVATSLNHNQNGEDVSYSLDLPIAVDVVLGTVVPNATTINGELSSIYNATRLGDEVITVDVLGIDNTISFFVKNAMPKIAIDDVITPWSLGVYPGVINYFDIKLINNEDVSIDNVTIELVSNESDELLGSFVGLIDKGTSTISLIDYTIREINEKAIWPGAQENNLINFNISIKYDGETISSFSADKILAYNGYFNKTYVYGGHDNIINRNYTINGDIIVSTQDVSVYEDQFSRFRNETWNIETPEDAEIVKVLLYFNYNWDTSFFPDGWTLEFNSHNILDEYISHEMDRGNLGIWGAYNYGLLVFDVTDYYNVNADNSFIINKTGNCALYPSTLYVLYNITGSDSIKDIYFSDICDVFYPLYNQYGYDDLLKYVVNFDNIDLTNLHEANWYVFTGSSSVNNKLSFNNMTISNPFVNYSPNDCRPFVYNVTDLISQNNEVWFISTVESSTTVAYEQVLVVERGINTTIELDFNNLTLVIDSNITINPIVTPVKANVTYVCNDTSVATIDENGLITAIKSGKALITVIAGDGIKYSINSTNFTLTVNKKQPTINSSVSFDEVSLSYDINVELPSDASGNVTVSVDGKSFEGVVSNGKATVSVVGLDSGSKNATIIYSGDYKYNSVEVSKQFVVNKVDPSLSVVAPDVDYGSDAVISVSLPADAAGNVTVSVDGKDYVETIDNSKVIFTISGLAAGNKTFTVRYDGDNRYNNKSASSSFNVNKISATLTTSIPAVDYGSDAVVTVSLPVDAAGNVTVTVNGRSYNVSVKNAEVSVSIPDLNAGSHDVTIIYDGDSNYLKTTASDTITVNKINPSMTVSVSDINVGEPAKFVVSGLPSDATGNVTVTVDGKYNSSILSNGECIVEISGLKEGNYQATVSYLGDTNHNPISDSKNIAVSKNNPQMNVNANNIKYGETVIFEVTLASDATGTVTVHLNGKSDSKTIENGKATLEIDGLIKGDFDYIVTYEGDDKYNSDTQSNKISVGKTETSFTVNPVNDINVDDSANFAISGLPTDANGKITVTINNGQSNSANVVNGKADIIITISSEGSYTAKVSYSDDENYMANAVDVTFNVNKITPEMVVNVTDIDVGESARFVVSGLPNDVSGNVTVVVDGKSQSAKVSNGKATLNVDDLSFGSKTATVTYSGDYKYDSVEVSKQFAVNKVDPSVSVIAPNVDYGVDAVVTVILPVDATGNVTVTVDGKDYNGTVEDSKITFTISGLTAGTKDLAVKYGGNDKYVEKSTSYSFEVNKISAALNISIPAVDYGSDSVVAVSLPTDAAGNVTVTVNGRSYNVSVKNAEVSVSIPDLNAGSYDVTIVYNGDSNYLKTTVSDTMTVNKIDSAMTVNVSDIDVGESAVFNVVLPDDSNGKITVAINDGQSSSFDVVNGKVDISFKMTAKGSYTAKVSYSGDENYMDDAVNVSFNVNKITTTISAAANNISVGESAIIVVSGLPSDASGEVTVTIDGKYYSANVSNGNASINITGLTEGSKEAVVSYSGDEKYMNATTSVNIVVEAKVEPLAPSVNVTLPSEVSVGDIPDVEVSLPVDAKGNVTVKLDGNKISDLPLTNGTISVPLSDLGVGNHTVEIIYSGDEKYLPASSIRSITVKKKATHINVVASFTRLATDYLAGERGANYKGYLLDENNNPVVNRIVKITVNGLTYNVKTNKKGEFYLQINLKAAKEYPMKVSFSGDDVYDKAPIAKTKLTVIKKSSSVKASNNVFKAKTKNKKIKITLKTVKNKYNGKTYLKKGKKITLKVNGKTYTAKTNAKGVAQFSIKLKKKGNFKAVIKFKGDKTYKACSKTIMIRIK